MTKVIATVLFCFIFLSTNLWAHGGGLDSNGCHSDSNTNTRHCHTTNLSYGSGTSGEGDDDAAIILLAVVTTAGLVWWLHRASNSHRGTYSFEIKEDHRIVPTLQFAEDEFSPTLAGLTYEIRF